MNKIDKILLIAAGIISFLAGLMHFTFFPLFHSIMIGPSPDYMLIPPTLNAGSILFTFTIAYTSVFHSNDLIKTSIGKPLLISFACLYIIRLSAEFVFARYSIFWISFCLALAIVYIRIFTLNLKWRKTI